MRSTLLWSIMISYLLPVASVVNGFLLLFVLVPLVVWADETNLLCRDVTYSDYSDNLYNVNMGDARVTIREGHVSVAGVLLKTDGVYQISKLDDVYTEAIWGPKMTDPRILFLDRSTGQLSITKTQGRCQMDWMIEALCESY